MSIVPTSVATISLIRNRTYPELCPPHRQYADGQWIGEPTRPSFYNHTFESVLSNGDLLDSLRIATVELDDSRAATALRDNFGMGAWRSGVFQVVTADGRVLGAAFSIFGGRVLTCRHVLEHRSRVEVRRSDSEPLYDYRDVFLFRSVDRGLVRVAEWALHDTYDIACGRLASGMDPLETVPLETRVVMPSTPVTCAGFPASGAGTLVTFGRQVAGRTQQGFLLDGASAPGMSGGPALVNGRAVGVVYADALDENVTLLVPLNEISDWIADTLPPRLASPEADLGLTAVPISGSLRAHDISPRLVRIFSDAFGDVAAAHEHLGEAMRLRREHNPEGYTDEQILVRRGEIGWGTGADAYWFRILEACLRRSQRTLAALFYAERAPHPDFLSPADTAELERFRSKLLK